MDGIAVVGPGMVRFGTCLILRPEEVCASKGWPPDVACKTEAAVLGLQLLAASRRMDELVVVDGDRRLRIKKAGGQR